MALCIYMFTPPGFNVGKIQGLFQNYMHPWNKLQF